MRKEIQEIRRSQFVYTYGPGALLEGKNGPRLIPSIEKGLGSSFGNEFLKEFEISDSRLNIAVKQFTRAYLTNQVHIFSLPTNAVLKESKTRGLYYTYIFPNSKICYGSDKNHRPILFFKGKCPICKAYDNSSAIRFISACSNGHLDDINWHYAVHLNSNNKNCNPNYYMWMAGGSSLSSIIIKCPQCENSVTMKQIYYIDFKCTARYPEKESFHFSKFGPPYYPQKKIVKHKCNSPMKVMQRQSTSLRITNCLTLLTIPEFDDKVSRLIQRGDIQAIINTVLTFDPKLENKNLLELFISSLKSSKISDESISVLVDHVEKNSFKHLVNLYKEIHDENREFLDYIKDEFKSLVKGSRETDNFSMGKPSLFDTDSNCIPKFEIYPVKKLRTVTVQLGYKRLVASDSNKNKEPKLNLVSAVTPLNREHWFPGFVGNGEGIFLLFNNLKPLMTTLDLVLEDWLDDYNKKRNDDDLWQNIRSHPLFVWLHTLSHSVIRSLSLFSGYSSASLRERIYLDVNESSGGILIYTSSPGQDASMGGLLGSIKYFEEIIKMSVETIQLCSNDPLCIETRKTINSINGAGCHSCLLLSETSCEHQNKFLDRHLLLGNGNE